MRILSENLYEGMFLLDSAKFATNPDGLTSEVLGILEKAGGSVVVNRPWQDGRLAYPIEGHRKGLHYLAYFRMEGAALKDVNRACQLNDNILRHLVIKQPQALFDAMVSALGQSEESSDSSESKAPEEKTAEEKTAEEKTAEVAVGTEETQTEAAE